MGYQSLVRKASKSPGTWLAGLVATVVLFPSALSLKRYLLVNDVNANHRNITAFLLMLRYAEGTSGTNGYRTLFGGGTFNSYSHHPNQKKSFKNTKGEVQYTTAAGAYQFLYGTWERLRKKLGLTDFSPSSQDRAALELIAEKGAISDIVNGRIKIAMSKVRKVWASLPDSGYNQPTMKRETLLTKYRGYGGTVA